MYYSDAVKLKPSSVKQLCQAYIFIIIGDGTVRIFSNLQKLLETISFLELGHLFSPCKTGNSILYRHFTISLTRSLQAASTQLSPQAPSHVLQAQLKVR